MGVSDLYEITVWLNSAEIDSRKTKGIKTSSSSGLLVFTELMVFKPLQQGSG